MSFKSVAAIPQVAQVLTVSQQILNVRNAAGSVVSIDAKFATIDSTAELATYSGNYSAATGVYTVPAGGHKNVLIRAASAFSAASATSNGSLSIVIDGVSRAVTYQNIAATVSQNVAVEFAIKTLTAGQLIKIGVGADANHGFTGGDSSFFQIFATS